MHRTHEEDRAVKHDRETHPKIEAALELDKKIRDAVAALGRSYILLAKLFEEAKRTESWKVFQFDSCQEYIQDRTGASRSGVYLAISIVRELSGDVPEAELDKIPLSNAQTLAYTPSKFRSDPANIRAAQEMPAKDFTHHVDRKCPTLHIKEVRSVHVDLWLDKSLNDKWEEAVEKGKRILSTESKNVVLEAMIALFLETPDDVLLQAHQHEVPDISEAQEVEA